MEESNSELETFRQQWRAEVSARSKGDHSKTKTHTTNKAQPSKPLRRLLGQSRTLGERSKRQDIINDEESESVPSVQTLDSHPSGKLSANDDIEGYGSKSGSQEPRSALEHYEQAVERESQGNLGDSLNLYRKAFKMDDAVDVKYRRKHFPPSYFASKTRYPNPSNASQTEPSTAHHSLDGPPHSIKDLLAGFQGLNIEPAQPEIEGMPALSCPISTLPHEILVHILMDTAILDIAAFVRLSQVCKRLAYMVNTEEQIWKRICLGSEVGFGTMHYQWQREISGSPLDEKNGNQVFGASGAESDSPIPRLDAEISSFLLLHNFYSASWQKMFRLRPRIRFNGCYISTVNYIRPGQASPSQITWNSPVHIVTYYRYLRFYRDGTVISLLTTTEPPDVVHFLTRSLQESHKGGSGAHLPSAVMQNALQGRWRLSSASDNPAAELKDAEGDLFIETEGVGKYIFCMELVLRSAGKGARNNKLAWKAYYHYNRLTPDDRGEFTLRNDKAFFWSRVKSYDMAE